jgi:hypothetical protein
MNAIYDTEISAFSRTGVLYFKHYRIFYVAMRESNSNLMAEIFVVELYYSEGSVFVKFYSEVVS